MAPPLFFSVNGNTMGIAPPALLARVLKMGVVSNFLVGPHHYKSASYVHVCLDMPTPGNWGWIDPT
jgi:hypothetical protein